MLSSSAPRRVRSSPLSLRLVGVHHGKAVPAVREALINAVDHTDYSQREATWSEANPEDRWRSFSYEEILARHKVSLDRFWLRDESIEDSANLPEPHLLAQEIADDLRSALAQIDDGHGDLERCASWSCCDRCAGGGCSHGRAAHSLRMARFAPTSCQEALG